MYVCMYVCTYVRTYVCMYVCMYVCVYTYTLYIYIYVCVCVYIYIYIYIHSALRGTPTSRQRMPVSSCSYTIVKQHTRKYANTPNNDYTR